MFQKFKSSIFVVLLKLFSSFSCLLFGFAKSIYENNDVQLDGR